MGTPIKVAFVCLHGSAKSLIAAEYLNRLAREPEIGVSATTSGPEPDAAVPPNVIEGLDRRGIDARHRRPARVTAAGIADATLIVSFACNVDQLAPAGIPIERWDECPAVSDDFDVAWEFITARVEQLADRLGG